jgi:Mn-dependent DtxR family transcriptional regulator
VAKKAARPEQITAPVEDYLKAIYAFERDGHAAATNDIAQRLSIAPASVSGMVQRLADQGLVEYERYRGVRLTSAGRRAALRTLRRHRIIESYLVQALGYPWDVVHEEAERLEHAASDTLIDRMAAAIGEPVTDPHGAPIPTREGKIDETPHQTLADAPVGSRTRGTGRGRGPRDAALSRFVRPAAGRRGNPHRPGAVRWATHHRGGLRDAAGRPALASMVLVAKRQTDPRSELRDQSSGTSASDL